jgi:hypothetical protein
MLKKAAFFTPRKGGIASADADVAAWIAAVGAANTNPGEVAALTAMVTGLKSDFAITLLSQKWDRLWVYCLGTAAAAAVDLVARASHTPVNGPTFTPLQGYTGNGTSSYINTGYNPVTNGTKYLQNDATFMVEIKVADNRTGAFFEYCGSTDQSKNNAFNRASNNTQFNWGINNSSTSENTTFSTQLGLLAPERTGSGGGASTLYQNGVSIGVGANASGTLTSQPFFVLATNNGSGGPALWNNGRVRAFAAGGSLGATGQANFNARIVALFSTLGAT